MIKYNNLKKNEIDEFREVLGNFHMLHDFNETKVLEKYIKKYPDLVMVAKDHNKIIGTIIGQGAGSIIGSLWSISVLPEYRGKGIGAELIKRLTTKLVIKYKCLWVTLVVNKDNNAISLYKKIGFRSDDMHSYGLWGSNLKKFIS